MAETSYSVNHPLAVKLWSRKLFQEALKQTWMNKFIGKDSDSLITLKEDTAKGKGDQITIGLRMQLSGQGILGDGPLMNNEEQLTTHHFVLTLDQLRHAVRSAGEMSNQRVTFDMREEARLSLQDWWADRLDTALFNQLCANVAKEDVRYTGNQIVESVDSGHLIYPGQAKQDEELKAEDRFSLPLIDAAVEKAKTSDPTIRPLKIDGVNKYVLFLHPYQVTDLRSKTGEGSWLDIQKAALSGGKIKDNPIYTGALGEYNNVILHESTRVTEGVTKSGKKSVPQVRRAVFCGAQAAVMAIGQNASGGSEGYKMSWVEESFDYQNQLGVSAGMIFGLKRTRFKDRDFATIVIPTFADAHFGVGK